MTERMISVPESLLRRALDLRGLNYQPAQEVRAEILALLEQPTAEPRDKYLAGASGVSDEPWGHAVAAQPSIADMPPGTTFRGTHARYGDRLWRVKSEDLVWDTVQNFGVRSTGIDPSTIRDVTPPKEHA